MIPVRNPRTGAVDFALTPATPEQVGAEAHRLRTAQPAWAAFTPEKRADGLRRWAGAVEAHRGTLVEALAADTGRWKISEIEIDGLPRTLRRWADRGPPLLAELAAEDRPSAMPGVTLAFRRSPYPLFGAIAPWNFPIVLSTIDAIPALMAGCAALVKPSEVTPRVFGPLRETIPPDLPLAFVEGGPETGQALIDQVDYLCFTGSVPTGRKVAEAAARAFIPANLELGGKDPMIVLASADPVAAAAVALRASVVNTGQACQSIERVYVAREIAETFLAALVAQADAVRLNADDIGVGDIGPFIFDKQAAIVQAQIDDAVAKGATLLTGGKIEDHGGLYLRPTVLTDITPDMAVTRDETFGPVIPVTVFDTVDEAVALANSGEFGLSAAVVGPGAAEVAARLTAGAVSIDDGALTSMVWDAEKSSFGASGLGASRMGDSGLTRFLRRQALLRQTGRALPLATYAEETLR